MTYLQIQQEGYKNAELCFNLIKMGEAPDVYYHNAGIEEYIKNMESFWLDDMIKHLTQVIDEKTQKSLDLMIKGLETLTDEYQEYINDLVASVKEYTKTLEFCVQCYTESMQKGFDEYVQNLELQSLNGIQ